jgi:hypothetical protein
MSIMNKIPHGRAFISYSYKDKIALDQLKLDLPNGVNAAPFPPITVSPAKMVSNDLIDAINNCNLLIYINTPNARNSRWVAMERDYARRVGLPVYSYVPTKRIFQKDRNSPLDLPVFPSYSKQDRESVQKIIGFMKNERYFDVFIDEDSYLPGRKIVDTLMTGIYERLERSGYTVLFLSESSLASSWVSNEIEASLTDFPDQILIAQLEKTKLPILLTDRVPIKLYRNKKSGLDYRRVDDLIVWLYWLIQRNIEKQ